VTASPSATKYTGAPPIAPPLTADRTVITWDLRGHGSSASPVDPSAYSEEVALADMVAVLDSSAHGPVVLVGMSLGGYLSLAFHGRYPERVAALVLVDTGPGFKNDEARDRWNGEARANAADYMAARIPDAELVVIPRAGHASNLDQPEAFNAAVTAFLDRVA
jgi:pimeloyl-ACP methyl ester carboxylesterase